MTNPDTGFEGEKRAPREIPTKGAREIAKIIEGGREPEEEGWSGRPTQTAVLAALTTSVAVLGVVAPAETADIRGCTIDQIVSDISDVENDYQVRLYQIIKKGPFVSDLKKFFDDNNAKIKFPIAEKENYTKSDIRRVVNVFFEEIRRSVTEEWVHKLSIVDVRWSARIIAGYFWDIWVKNSSLQITRN
jgi:hypothetical protein